MKPNSSRSWYRCASARRRCAKWRKAAVFFQGTYDEKAVRKHITTEVPALLAEAMAALSVLQDWSAAAIHELISGVAAARGVSLGKLAQPLRLAVCGATISPPIDATLAILGKPETLWRLARAQALWSA
jgi:glutamyl-tRNA synthetase